MGSSSEMQGVITDLSIIPPNVGIGKNLCKNWTKCKGAIIRDTTRGETEVLA